MNPGSSAARFWVGMGAGKAEAEIKTYLSTTVINKGDGDIGAKRNNFLSLVMG